MDYNPATVEETISKYNFISSSSKNPDNFIFMNYGYADIDYKGNLLPKKDLSPIHSNWYNQTNFFKYILSLKHTYEGDILDISCGRGGGVSVFKEYYNFNKIVGIDINSKNINFCKNKFKNIDFFEAEATNLPFKNNSFDIITNVEAFEYYYHEKEKFFSEISRLLRPNGIFLLAHFEPYNFEYKNQFKDFNLELISEIDITKNVQKALEIDIQTLPIFDSFLKETCDSGVEYLSYCKYKIFVCQKYGI